MVDLFAGAGGLALGFEQAGFDIAAALEIDPIHAATHRYNFPECATLCADAVTVAGTAIRERIGRPIDVVAGGAPCQGFSMIGQRALDDPRNQLVRHFLRLVVELEPRIFVLENVRGLTLGAHRRFLDEVIAAFEEEGYRVAQPWQVLNAKHFGVPQDRQRLFLIGAHRDCRLPKYPEGDLLPQPPSCADALGDLPDVDNFADLLHEDSIPAPRMREAEDLSAYAKEMRCQTDDAWHFGHRRLWDPNILTASRRTVHTAISRRRFAATAPGSVEPVSRFFKLAAGGVSNTLRAGTDSARGAFTSPRPIHYRDSRCITVREMARLHGFPDWFRFHVTKWHGARQIGNAVPPPLARAVAGMVMQALGASPNRPSRPIALGPAELLRVDMTAAASYWDVPIPIKRRDRKSGVRKRKQQEIERRWATSTRATLSPAKSRTPY